MSIKIGMPWKSSFPRIRIQTPDPYSGAWASGIGNSTVSEDGRTLITGYNDTSAVRGYWNTLVTSGKIYIEVKIHNVSTTSTSPYWNPACGWLFSNSIIRSFFGNNISRAVYWWNGSVKTEAAKALGNLGSYHDGIIVMFARDVENNKYWIGQDGVWYNGATVSDIEAGNKAIIKTGSLPYFVTGDGDNGRTSYSYEINQGQKPYAYQKPEGFTPMGVSLRA